MAISIKNILTGNLGNVMSNAGGLFSPVKKATKSTGYPTVLTKSDLWADTGSDITVTAGKSIRIGEYTIPDQTIYHIGYGVSGGNPEEIGHFHMDIVDDTATNSAQEPGNIIIGYTDSEERLKAVMWECRTERASDTDTTTGISYADQPLLPELSPSLRGYSDALATEKNKIFIDFVTDANDTIVETGIGTGAINVWSLPVTIYSTIM